MSKILVVVDMQKDFVNGSLGSKEAQAIVPNVIEKIKACQADRYSIVLTQDTHDENYLDSTEGKYLPVKHCVKGTEGHNILDEIIDVIEYADVIEKPTFGSYDLIYHIKDWFTDRGIEEIQFIGVCTDICVMANCILAKTSFPDAKVVVDSSCCAGVTPESHAAALTVLKSCQVEVI